MSEPRPLRQDDFSAGEIARSSWGKRASPSYQHGLRTALNFLPTLDGPIHNRPGTKFVCAVKDPTVSPTLVSFRFSDTQTFVLEIGAGYIRFVSNGAQVVVAGVAAYNGATNYVVGDLALSGGVNYYCIAPTVGNAPPNGAFWYALTGVIYEIPAPWAAADLPRLQASPNGDIITISCLGPQGTQYPPQELTRFGNTRWTLAAASFSPPAHFAPGLMISRATTGAGVASIAAAVSPDRWDSTVTYKFGDLVLQDNAGPVTICWFSNQDNNTNHDPNAGGIWWISRTYDLGPVHHFPKGHCTHYATTSKDSQFYVSLSDGETVTPPGTGEWALANDTARVPTKQSWVETLLYRDEHGVVLETLASAPTQDIKVYVGPDRPASLLSGPVFGANVPAFYTLLARRYFRGEAGVYGYVGSIDTQLFPFQLEFTDKVAAPDFGTQPPRGTNPFDFATGGNTKTQSYPAAVANHEQRRLFARSTQKPQDFWGSAIGKRRNFDLNTPVQDSDSFDFEPASEQLEDVRAMLSLRQLLLFTGGGVWNCYGANGPIAASNIVLRRSSRQGALFLRPLAIDMSALFFTARGHVRDLAWDFRTDNYNGRTLSRVAKHLFEGRLLTDWCYAEHPFSLVYAVRDDGTLLTMTYELGTAEGWARHTTLGRFEKVASVYEVDPVLPPATRASFEDAVYTVVRRVVNGATKRYIERFSSRLVPKQPVTDAATGLITFTSDVRLSNFLDAALTYDGRGLVQNFTVSEALGNVGDIVGGDNVIISALANMIADPTLRGFNAGDIGKSIFLDQDGAAGGPYEITITGITDALHATGTAQVLIPGAYNGVLTPFAGLGVKVIGGLAHLAGMSVGVLADGAPLGPFVVDVATSTITLQNAALIAQIGLPYVSDWEMLDVAGDALKLNVSSVRRVSLEVENSLGMLSGETFDIRPGRTAAQLVAPPLFTLPPSGGLPRLFSGDAVAFTPSSWNVGGRACVRQTAPLPLTIVAATRELVLGGK